MAGFESKYKTDEKAVVDGKWFDLGDGVRVKVVRLDNNDARKMRSNLERPYRGREVPVNKSEDFLSMIVARTIIKDWEGVVEGGNEVTFSSEEALRLFRKYPDFRDDVAVVSADREQFRAESLEEDVGN